MAKWKATRLYVFNPSWSASEQLLPHASESESVTVCTDVMPALPPSAKLKILCLHGYAQNAEFFRQRTGSIRKNLKSTCDFHFVDAPHEATASFLTADADGDGRGANLGWWNAAEERERPATSKAYCGLDESLALAQRTIREHGPFDGLLDRSWPSAAHRCDVAVAVEGRRPRTASESSDGSGTLKAVAVAS